MQIWRKLRANDLEIIGRKFTIEEVLQALNDMGPMKAPGPDGFDAIFYQNFWNIVEPRVMATCLGVLNDGKSIVVINGTNIVLILKKRDPNRMADYRPISLCTVVYKLFTKPLQIV